MFCWLLLWLLCINQQKVFHNQTCHPVGPVLVTEGRVWHSKTIQFLIYWLGKWVWARFSECATSTLRQLSTVQQGSHRMYARAVVVFTCIYHTAMIGIRPLVVGCCNVVQVYNVYDVGSQDLASFLLLNTTAVSAQCRRLLVLGFYPTYNLDGCWFTEKVSCGLSFFQLVWVCYLWYW